jgi:hypothetical protein
LTKAKAAGHSDGFRLPLSVMMSPVAATSVPTIVMAAIAVPPMMTTVAVPVSALHLNDGFVLHR